MDYFYEDEEFAYEYNIGERVGEAGELDGPSEDPKDPHQKFNTFVQAIAHSLNQNNFCSIGARQLQEMTFKSQLLKFPQYKNPTAFVVGYTIVDDGVISKQKFEKILPHFDKFEYPIRPEDAIRYANLWINELNG